MSDTPSKSNEPTKKRWRRQYIVDRKLQLSMVLTMVGCLVGVGIVFLAAQVILPEGRFLDGMRGDSVRSLVIRLITGFFLTSAVAISMVVVIVSHRVAGPAMVYRRALRSFIGGDFDARLSTRKKDYLGDLGEALEDLRSHLKDTQRARGGMVAQLEQAIASGDLQSARELVRNLERLDLTAEALLADGQKALATSR